MVGYEKVVHGAPLRTNAEGGPDARGSLLHHAPPFRRVSDRPEPIPVSLPFSFQGSYHLTTRLARYSMDGAIVSPRASAVFRLMANSMFGFASTGISAGSSPLRILSTRRAA